MNALAKTFRPLFARMGQDVLTFLEYVGGLCLLTSEIVRAIPKKKFEWYQTARQVVEIGVNSLSLTNLIAVFTGAVLALQFIIGLSRFGLQLYTGQVVGIAITRELGPVLTALMVAARVGSGMTAELGSMTVSEQVMAIRAMGGSPISKLVLPRVLVATLVTPILTVIADLVGVVGGMVVTNLEAGVSYPFYWEQVTKTVQPADFVSGVAKTVFFGFFIGLIACYKGLNVTGGTKGVGQATTSTVVHCSVAIFVSDFILTKVFLVFE